MTDKENALDMAYKALSIALFHLHMDANPLAFSTGAYDKSLLALQEICKVLGRPVPSPWGSV